MKTGVHMTGHRWGESHPLHQQILLHPTWQWQHYDWVSTIQRPLSSCSPSILHHFTRTSNTIHEDTTTITRSLIRGFLQTCSVDVINRSCRTRHWESANYAISWVRSLLKHRRRRQAFMNHVFCKSWWLMKYVVLFYVCLRIFIFTNTMQNSFLNFKLGLPKSVITTWLREWLLD
jgi:hypothetical protein